MGSRKDKPSLICVVCKKPFRAIPGRNHVCSEACRRERGTYASRLQEAYVEHVDRMAVFERDGWRCYICNRECLREAGPKYHPHKPEIDHKIPLSSGGEHSYANVGCACGRCNRVKHGKSLPNVKSAY